ncbi:hypothetical protein F751_5221 [Auxenochlorella protothecoides]|uniref:Uncharacterized protein n=2 Tax=Auxenochlorella protothecoides TaxID=3075 RepID=A0A087SQV6_AUXPR|nr:hypothetical protein F751_5221 [Auxenochlorella protothecoides]KFM28110.1 hypothetical protein F751_5221 [Auxenochlorella protothecoides]
MRSPNGGGVRPRRGASGSEASISLDPRHYVYGDPTPSQQLRLSMEWESMRGCGMPGLAQVSAPWAPDTDDLPLCWEGVEGDAFDLEAILTASHQGVLELERSVKDSDEDDEADDEVALLFTPAASPITKEQSYMSLPLAGCKPVKRGAEAEAHDRPATPPSAASSETIFSSDRALKRCRLAPLEGPSRLGLTMDHQSAADSINAMLGTLGTGPKAHARQIRAED